MKHGEIYVPWLGLEGEEARWSVSSSSNNNNNEAHPTRHRSKYISLFMSQGIKDNDDKTKISNDVYGIAITGMLPVLGYVFTQSHGDHSV